MAKRIPHKSGDIVVLDEHETLNNQCSPGDTAVAIDPRDGLWYVVFVSADGGLHGWDDGYTSAEDAVKDIQQA